MKTESVICDCGRVMLKVRAQSGKGDIALGYYCPGCLAVQNMKREYLIPADLITRLDPYFNTVPKYAAFLAIVKTKDRLIPPTTTDDKIETFRKTVGAALVPFCRQPGKRESPRLDREKFSNDLQNDFNKVVRAQEIKEAAGNQPK